MLTSLALFRSSRRELAVATTLPAPSTSCVAPCRLRQHSGQAQRSIVAMLCCPPCSPSCTLATPTTNTPAPSPNLFPWRNSLPRPHPPIPHSTLTKHLSHLHPCTSCTLRSQHQGPYHHHYSTFFLGSPPPQHPSLYNVSVTLPNSTPSPLVTLPKLPPLGLE